MRRILCGIALAPALHTSVLAACKGSDGAVSPASTLRTFALLIALARGGLTMRLSHFSKLKSTVLLLSLLPYAMELLVEASVAQLILPASSGLTSPSSVLPLFMAAAIWAPLSPSIVIPNMLDLSEAGYKHAGDVILSSAPLEVAVAIMTFTAMEGAQKSLVAPASSSSSMAMTYGMIPVQLIGSVCLGIAVSALFWIYHAYMRPSKLAIRIMGKREPIESVLVFAICFFGVYALCTDSAIPRVIGLLAALSLGVGTQRFCPELAPGLALQLKGVWTFAECFLFVLTGVVVRGAIDSDSAALSPAVFGMLVIGSLARLSTNIIVAVVWEFSVHKAVKPTPGSAAAESATAGTACAPYSRPWQHRLKASAIRTVFLWTATIPKATLQASLGPKPLAEAAALGITTAAGAFIAQSAALAVLYCGVIGSLTTFFIGRPAAAWLEKDHDAALLSLQEYDDAEAKAMTVAQGGPAAPEESAVAAMASPAKAVTGAGDDCPPKLKGHASEVMLMEGSKEDATLSTVSGTTSNSV